MKAHAQTTGIQCTRPADDAPVLYYHLIKWEVKFHFADPDMTDDGEVLLKNDDVREWDSWTPFLH